MAKDDDRNEPVSLAPLTPEEALRALLAVRPDDEPVDEARADGAEPESKRPAQSSD